jgi:hypothetical protein
LAEQPLPEMASGDSAASDFMQNGGDNQQQESGLDASQPSAASNFINPEKKAPSEDSAVSDFVHPKSAIQKFIGDAWKWLRGN